MSRRSEHRSAPDDWRETVARSVQARMRADGLINPSREPARFHMKRSHFWAGVACYALLLALLLFAVFGPWVAQCMLGVWP